MDDLKERIFELASQDDEFAEKLNAAETPEAAAALLADKGLDVSAGDLQALAQPAEGAVKLSEDELDAVAGGGACYCVVGGYGSKNDHGDYACGCAVAGYGDGHYRNGKLCRCACFGEGGGESVCYGEGDG